MNARDALTFSDYIEALPQKRRKYDGTWKATQTCPCPLLMKCSTCKEYKSIFDFYEKKRHHSGRIDALGKFYPSQCQRCGKNEFMNKGVKYRLVMAAKARAKQRGYECEIGVDDFEIPEYCPVLGIRLWSHVGGGSIGGSNNWSAPTLDRIDNSKGYVVGNVAVISRKANSLKWNGTPEELAAVATYAVKAAMGEYSGGSLEKPFIETQELYHVKSVDKSKYQIPEGQGVTFNRKET